MYAVIPTDKYIYISNCRSHKMVLCSEDEDESSIAKVIITKEKIVPNDEN